MTKRTSRIGIAVGILLLLVLLGLVAENRHQQQTKAASQTAAAQKQTTTKARPYILANDETQQKDELSAEKVNTARLRTRIEARQQAQPVDTAELDSQINAILSQNQDIKFGVSIIDVSTGATHDYGNTAPMTAASVTKVLTATDYLKQVELGKKSLSTVMVDGHTAQYDMEQMIVVSDNNAWHVLNEDLGYQQMQDYAHSIGLDSYAYSDNTISSNDTTQLLHDLYTRKLINETNAELLLSYMERANYRDLIIPAVPEYDTVYHKAGEYLVNLNDAAIITNSEKAIVISIFTESLNGYSKSRVSKLMQQITTPVLATFGLN